MTASESVRYRLALASGFLTEARQDHGLGRWRSCVDNSQLVVENAGKAVLLVFGASPKTHDPGRQLAELLRTGAVDDTLRDDVQGLIEDIGRLGPAEHVLTDYGDEATWTLPWDLFSQSDADLALDYAEGALARARALTGRLGEETGRG